MAQITLRNLLIRRSVQTRFRAERYTLLSRAREWASPREALDAAEKALAAIARRPPVAKVKGAPDIVSLKREWAGTLLELLESDHGDTSQQSELARNLAAVQPDDPDAYLAYLAIYCRQNWSVLTALRIRLRRRHVVLHVTCQPRLGRAHESANSFRQQDEVGKLTHVFLVGDRNEITFDTNSGVLGIAASDAYEHLPGKVFGALELLSLTVTGLTVLKVDDDHRLASFPRLLARMNALRDEKRPTQEGTVYTTRIPSGHNRAWHFGKCRDESRNLAPIGFPSPVAWITGEHGYLLNAAAIDNCGWAAVYYRQWLERITYEDVAMAECADKLGTRLVHLPLTTGCLTTVSDY